MRKKLSFKPKHLARLARIQEITNRVVDEMGVPKNEEESNAMAKRLKVELDLLVEDER